MKWNLQRSARSLALCAVLAGAMALTHGHAAAGQASDDARARKLEGAWVAHVSVHDCQSGAPITAFQSITTFAPGGVATNITTGASPAQRTTALGTWHRTGGQAFTSVVYAYLFSSAGAWTATQRIAFAVEIGSDPDAFTGITDVNFINTNGDVFASACATVVGNRLR
jgi:hypothetical protein